MSAVIEGNTIGGNEQQNPSFWFGRGFWKELREGPKANHRIGELLTEELATRKLHQETDTKEQDWEMFTNKLLRFRPRLVGAVAAYSLLSGLTYEEVQQNSGMDAFRLIWFLGSSQDDLIDEIPKEEMTGIDHKNKIRRLNKAIFGPERIFYQAGYTAFVNGIESANLTPEQRTYIKTAAAEWYKFLVDQEAGVFDTPTEQMNFDYCVTYRETQMAKLAQH